MSSTSRGASRNMREPSNAAVTSSANEMLLASNFCSNDGSSLVIKFNYVIVRPSPLTTTTTTTTTTIFFRFLYKTQLFLFVVGFSKSYQFKTHAMSKYSEMTAFCFLFDCRTIEERGCVKERVMWRQVAAAARKQNAIELIKVVLKLSCGCIVHHWYSSCSG
jgi:hypothetical protein